eukprot:SM000122S25778  [mRNA]  locus=s122:188645:191422:- [translate_table: standard]
MALHGVDALFMRSRLFRALLVEPGFDAFLQLTVGYQPDRPLPPPADRAALLRRLAIEAVERWKDAFGLHYRQVDLGYHYLKDTLRMQFPNLRERAEAAQRQRDKKEAHVRELYRGRYAALLAKFGKSSQEVLSTLAQMEEAFGILVPRVPRVDDAGTSAGAFWTAAQAAPVDEHSDSGDEGEQYGITRLRAPLREVANSATKVLVTESADNGVVFDMLRELQKTVIEKHAPCVQEWLSTLMRVDVEDSQKQQLLRATIDLRNQLAAASARCLELGVQPLSSARAEDELEWESGLVPDEATGDEPMHGHALEAPSTLANACLATNEVTMPPNAAPATPPSASGGEVESPQRRLRRELAAAAPRVPWGPGLERWGSEELMRASSHGMQLDNHWGRVDADAAVPAQRFLELATPVSTYAPPQQAPAVPCRAPLWDGRLCQRKDLVKCPLHGVIIPRDDTGRPLRGTAIVDDQKPAVAQPAVARSLKVAASLRQGQQLKSEVLLTTATEMQKAAGGGAPVEDQAATGDADVDNRRDQALAVVARQAVASIRKQDRGMAGDLRQSRRRKLAEPRIMGTEMRPLASWVAPVDDQVTGTAGGGDADGRHEDAPAEVAQQAEAIARQQDSGVAEVPRASLQRRRRADAAQAKAHNEAVLRAAGMAGSAQGLSELLGEDLEGGSGSESRQQGVGARKKISLAAMLRPKPTVRERIARRLLSGRVKDATVAQVAREEDRRYRESYPNRWEAA